MKPGCCRAPLVALCAILLSGCALFSPAKADTNKFVLDQAPGDLPVERTHPATLLVLAPETTAIYATRQMAYSTEANQIAYFAQNEWAEPPAQMIQALIVETLRRTHYFSEVLPPPQSGRHTYTLRTELLELKQDFTSAPAVLQLTLRVSLTREATNQVVASKELSAREPMREKNPAAGVEAANQAMTKVLRQLARFVVEKAR